MNDNNRNPMKPHKTNGNGFAAMWGLVYACALFFVMFVVFYNDPIWWLITLVGVVIAVFIGLAAGSKDEEDK